MISLQPNLILHFQFVRKTGDYEFWAVKGAKAERCGTITMTPEAQRLDVPQSQANQPRTLNDVIQATTSSTVEGKTVQVFNKS
jgi:hypothetical protein